MSYDLFVEPFVGRIRRAGLELYPPAAGMKVLDVGCGTGTTLRLYLGQGCAVHGIDASAEMVDQARRKLGEDADLRLGDAAHIPYPDASFDLVTATLALHEMPAAARSAIAGEIARVLRADGRAVLIDFQPDPAPSLLGRITRAVILCFETLAGRDHLRNGREFVTRGGLPALLAPHGLVVERSRAVASRQMLVCVMRHRDNTE